ncbi:helix-turn-helix transcriptional regulator [Roseateles sp. SL47]|uniref:helix-turn-helix transcriptional regulator n=1 Tax=Roseateles sp. SL47 TaxID=2995138 RepID=UPI0022705ECA|nr:helix-turn-helix transcriptional regulator [Roseateles sp. SL47]WAC72666.1 helix-turn-helix transcriptional regulator [Roseateles sp. SL47]
MSLIPLSAEISPERSSNDRSEAMPPEWLQDRLLVERLLESLWSARQPSTPAQFFVWSQSRLQPLLPHQLLVCLSASPPGGRLSAQMFNLKAVPPTLQAQMESPEHGLWLHLMRRWAPGRRALVVGTDESGLFFPLLDVGLRTVLVHGVGAEGDRPDSLFLLAGEGWSTEQVQQFELLTPTLHGAWRRSRGGGPRGQAVTARSGALVTPREQQIVEGLRAGLSNEGIAVQLGISMFTVKNHVRKILRKLGASNRAQAVAIAMARRDLSESWASEG